MASPRKKILVLVNPKSGFRRYKAAMDAAERVFRAKPFQARIHLLKSPQDLVLQVKRAVKARLWAVVVCGGDGTLNAAIKPLLGSKTRLGLVPMGTGNGFARGLSLPFDPLQACEVVAHSKETTIDVGTANEAVFVNILGAGLDAWIAQTANQYRFLTRISGFVRYFVAGLVSLFTFKPPVVKIRCGKKTVEKRCMVVAVANASQYGMGVSVCPDADMRDGMLDLVLLEPAGPLTILRNFPRLYNGKPLIGSHRLRGTHFEISRTDSLNPVPFHVDGEIAGVLPVDIKVKKRALRVFVP